VRVLFLGVLCEGTFFTFFNFFCTAAFFRLTYPKRFGIRESTAAAVLGRKGGRAKSASKTAAVRENGRKGGRPKKTE